MVYRSTVRSLRTRDRFTWQCWGACQHAASNGRCQIRTKLAMAPHVHCDAVYTSCNEQLKSYLLLTNNVVGCWKLSTSLLK